MWLAKADHDNITGMPCDECSRLFNQFEAALAAYRDAVGGMSGLHGFDLRFAATQGGQRRLDTALRPAVPLCRNTSNITRT